MSTHTSQPPLFILMHGLPAAGKSAFARQFAETHKMAHINSDRLRYELFDDASFSTSENRTVFRLARYISELLLGQGQPIVFDMNLPAMSARLELQRTTQNRGYNFVIAWVQTDYEEALRRAQTRDRRRLDDKYSAVIGEQLFSQIAAKSGKPNPDRETVAVLSGQQAFKHQRMMVEHRLRQLNFMSPALTEFNSAGAGRVDHKRRSAVSHFGIGRL